MENPPSESAGLSDSERILFIELRGGMAEFMMALPSIQAVGRSNPRAELEVLTSPECAELLEGDPSVARTHVVKRDESSVGPPDESFQQQEVERVLGKGSYDVVIVDAASARVRQSAESSGARVVISDLRGDASPDQLIEEQALATLAQRHLIEARYVNLVGRISLTEEEKKWARCWRGNNLAGRHQTVILNPTSGTPIKKWAAENFVTVGRWLDSRHHCNVVILSGDEPDLAARIGHEIGRGATILPKVGIRRLAAIANLSSLIISADSAPPRVAAASGAKAIVLFGPTSDVRRGLRPPHVNVRSPIQCGERDTAGFTDQSCWQLGQCVLDGGGQSSCVNNIAPDVIIRTAERMLHS